MLDGKLYSAMEFIKNAFVLNMLWLVLCLPIVTIFPATTAMFGVVRLWKSERQIKPFADFLRLFKENFAKSLLVGLFWITILGFLIGDFVILSQFHSDTKYIMYTLFIFLGILYIFASIYLVPILVHYQVSWIGVIKNALLLSVSHLHYTVLSILIIAITFIICLYIPALSLVSFSISAYLIYSVVSRSFPVENGQW